MRLHSTLPQHGGDTAPVGEQPLTVWQVLLQSVLLDLAKLGEHLPCVAVRYLAAHVQLYDVTPKKKENNQKQNQTPAVRGRSAHGLGGCRQLPQLRMLQNHHSKPRTLLHGTENQQQKLLKSLNVE